MLDLFWDQLDRLVNGKLGDLTLAGLSRSSLGTLYAGGVSVAAKQSYESMTDRVKPKFAKDMFEFPGVVDPMTTNTAS